MYIKSKAHHLPSDLRELFANGEASYAIEGHHRPVRAEDAMNYFLDCLTGFNYNNLDWNDKSTVYLTHPDFSYYAVVYAKSLEQGKSHAFKVSFAKKNEQGEFVTFSPKTKTILNPKEHEIDNTRLY